MGEPLPHGESFMRPGSRARVRFAEPDQTRLSFELTMSAAEWRHLMRQLPADGTAAGQLGMMISNMLGETLGRIETTYLAGAHFSRPANPEEA